MASFEEKPYFLRAKLLRNLLAIEAVGKTFTDQRVTCNAKKNGKPHFGGLTNIRRVRLRPGSDYLAVFLLVRIAITATPKPSRINNG
jgi:hypothetical protein